MNIVKHAMTQITTAVHLAQALTTNSQMLTPVIHIVPQDRSKIQRQTYAKKALRPYVLSLMTNF